MISESASAISRRIAAVPARTSTETWQAIVDLLAEAGSEAHQELTAITSIAAILISEEYTRDAPIVVKPMSGARIRVRTVHGVDAIEAINDETPLYAGGLSEPGWSLSLPCGSDDLDEITAALSGMAAITVRDTSEGISASAADRTNVGARAAVPVIDLNEMGRA
jgi:hypothetical protein